MHCLCNHFCYTVLSFAMFSFQTGTCALFFASQGGFLDIVKELISHGAPVDLPSYVSPRECQFTIVFTRADLYISYYMEVVKKPRVEGECVCQDGGTPLFVACQCNHVEVVEELVLNDADIQCQMVDGASPLFISSQNGHLRMVQYLLSKGAKPAMARKV